MHYCLVVTTRLWLKISQGIREGCHKVDLCKKLPIPAMHYNSKGKCYLSGHYVKYLLLFLSSYCPLTMPLLLLKWKKTTPLLVNLSCYVYNQSLKSFIIQLISIFPCNKWLRLRERLKLPELQHVILSNQDNDCKHKTNNNNVYINFTFQWAGPY